MIVIHVLYPFEANRTPGRYDRVYANLDVAKRDAELRYQEQEERELCQRDNRVTNTVTDKPAAVSEKTVAPAFAKGMTAHQACQAINQDTVHWAVADKPIGEFLYHLGRLSFWPRP